MALPLETILNKRSVIDKSFRKGRVKPWNFDDIDNKQITNRQQTDNKQITNRQQTDNKQITRFEDLEQPKELYREQTDNKQITNREQTDNKIISELPKESDEILNLLLSLSEQQQNMLFFIHDYCMARGSLSTGPLRSSLLNNHLNASNNTVRTQLFRLTSKKLIIRAPGKPGRGGFYAISMPSNVYRCINDIKRMMMNKSGNFEQENLAPKNHIDNKQITNREQTGNTIDNKDLSSSSSNNLIKTTTTSDLQISNIDISPLESIGFRQSHLEQILRRTNLEAEMIEQSILYFAFDLTYNNKAESLKSPPLNFFMGILNRGIPYSPPDNYEDPKEKALKEFKEKQKAQQQRLLELEKEAKEAAFNNWYQSLGKEGREKMLLGTIFADKSDRIKLTWFGGYFDKEIWPGMI